MARKKILSVKARLNSIEKRLDTLDDLKRLVLTRGRVGGKLEFIIAWFDEMFKEEDEIVVEEARQWADENGVSWQLMNRAKLKHGLFSVRRSKYFVWRKV